MQNNSIIKISLESTFTPYTLDLYQTFTMDDAEDFLIDEYNNENKKDYNYNSFSWGHNTKDYLQALSNNRTKLLNENIIDDVIINIKNDGAPTSPNFYNYDTDKQFNVWTVNIDALKKYINNNRDDYEKNKLKDAPGFFWFGGENETMLEYYLQNESLKKYSKDNYFYDQIENIDIYEYITITLIN